MLVYQNRTYWTNYYVVKMFNLLLIFVLAHTLPHVFFLSTEKTSIHLINLLQKRIILNSPISNHYWKRLKEIGDAFQKMVTNYFWHLQLWNWLLFLFSIIWPHFHVLGGVGFQMSLINFSLQSFKIDKKYYWHAADLGYGVKIWPQNCIVFGEQQIWVIVKNSFTYQVNQAKQPI